MIGSLLLGLYDDAGTLHHVGVTAAFPMAQRKSLVDTLAPYRDGALEAHPWAGLGHRHGRGQAGACPAAQSRWNAGKDQSWEPVRPELVVEVRYDHLQGARFRHGTAFVRFRDDRQARSRAPTPSSRRLRSFTWRPTAAIRWQQIFGR